MKSQGCRGIRIFLEDSFTVREIQISKGTIPVTGMGTTPTVGRRIPEFSAKLNEIEESIVYIFIIENLTIYNL